MAETGSLGMAWAEVGAQVAWVDLHSQGTAQVEQSTALGSRSMVQVLATGMGEAEVEVKAAAGGNRYGSVGSRTDMSRSKGWTSCRGEEPYPDSCRCGGLEPFESASVGLWSVTWLTPPTSRGNPERE